MSRTKRTYEKGCFLKMLKYILFIGGVLFTVFELSIGLFNIIWGKYDMNVNAQGRGWCSFINGVVLTVLLIVIYQFLF